MTSAPAAYLGLGANLGDRERNLIVALRRLEPLARVDAVSSLYESDPVPPEQPPYLNAVCRVITGLRPKALLRHALEVEREIGRRRGAHEHWGPRPIDIDLLLYGDIVVDEPGVRVPHPELPNRAFVLVPLAELAGDLRHPELGELVAALMGRVERSGLRAVAAPGWERGWAAGAPHP